MILVRALQANIQMVGLILSSRGVTILGTYQQGTPVGGLLLSLTHKWAECWIPSLVGPRFTILVLQSLRMEDNPACFY